MALNNPFSKSIFVFIFLPILSYFLAFSVLTYPLITYFDTAIMGDSQDAYQNVWSLWWFSRAMDDPKADLWHTNMLYYPQGASLYGHALSPLNGALAYPLQKFLSWHQVYNTLIIFNFVATGVSLFWFSYYYTKAWFPSLVAGGLYTFSTYHFLHSRGHIEMASMQWLTLSLFSLVWLLDKPSWKKAILAAIFLLLTLWNTPYHFLYITIVGLMLFMGYGWRYKRDRCRLKVLAVSLMKLVVCCMLILGSTLSSYLYHFTTQMFVGAHDARDFSAELFNYISKPNRFLGELTEGFWPKILEGSSSGEANVRLTLASIIFSGIALKLFARKDFRVNVWFTVGLIFLILSLGPVLLYQGVLPTINGKTIEISLPYAWLSKVLPPLRLSGVPGRMGVLPLLATCILTGFGLTYLQKKKKILLIVTLLILAVAESLPKTIPPLKTAIPYSISQLARLQPGGLLDLVHKPPLAMYYQLFHQKPLVDGYLSRISLTNSKYFGALTKAQETNNLWLLCTTYQVKYLWTNNQLDMLEPILEDQSTFLYDLKPQNICVN